MKSARLCPMVTAVVLFLGGAAALEVVASNVEGRVMTWHISGHEVAVDGEGQDDADDADDAWQSGEAVNEAHAEARLLARRGDYEQALARFAAAITSAPDSAALIAEYGHWLRRAGRRSEAEETLAKALAKSPESAPVHLDRALLARDRGDTRAALASFEEALRLRPMHAATRIAYARELLEHKRHDEAIALLLPVTEAGSNDRRARSLAALGQAYALAGRGAEARAALDLSQLSDESSAAEGLRYAQQAVRSPPTPPTSPTSSAAPTSAPASSPRPTPPTSRRRSSTAGSVTRASAWSTWRSSARTSRPPGAARRASSPSTPSGPSPTSWSAWSSSSPVACKRPAPTSRRRSPPRPRPTPRPGTTSASSSAAPSAPKKRSPPTRRRSRPARSTSRRSTTSASSTATAIATTRPRPSFASPTTSSRPTPPAGSTSPASTRPAAATTRPSPPTAAPSRSTPTTAAPACRSPSPSARPARPRRRSPEYRALLALQPRYVKAWFNLGIALATEGQDDEAVAAYEQALAHDQAHFGARKNLGLLLLRRERIDPAREHLTEAIEARPADPEIRLALAQIARQTGDAATCKTHVEAVLRQQPEDRSALELLEKCATPD